MIQKMRKMMSILFVCLTLYTFILVFFYAFQSSFLFYPQPLKRTISLNAQVEEVNIKTPSGNNLHGWLCKSKTENPQKVVIYFGGNAEEVSHLIPMSSIFDDWALLLVNYPGYGKSEGKPGEKSFFEAATSIYDYVISREDIDNEHIVLMGRSIGTGTAVYLVHERKVRAVILFSPFESIRAIAQSKLPFLPVGLLLKHQFEAKKIAIHIDIPMLAFYGTLDNIIPPKHSKNLQKSWKGNSNLIELKGFGHNDIFQSNQLWEEVTAFLRGI